MGLYTHNHHFKTTYKAFPIDCSTVDCIDCFQNNSLHSSDRSKLIKWNLYKELNNARLGLKRQPFATAVKVTNKFFCHISKY